MTRVARRGPKREQFDTEAVSTISWKGGADHMTRAAVAV